MAAVKLLGFVIVKSQAEKDIQKLFVNYEKALLAQKQKMCDDITEWGDALIQSISKHANLQKYYLEQVYSERVQYLNETCNQFIEDLHVREQMKSTEEINQLVEQCKALKFELAALETNVQTIPYIEVPCKKKSTLRNQDGFDAAETGMLSIDNGSTEKDDNESETGMNARSTLYINQSSDSTKQTETQSPPRKSAHGDSPSINDNGDQESSDVKDNGYVKKCPVCFMIFPLTMTAPDRSQHVQEHYVDD